MSIVACLLLGGSVAMGQPEWTEFTGPTAPDSLHSDQAPPTGLVVPAPDGALAGLTILTGLGIGYWLRHQRARRSRQVD